MNYPNYNSTLCSLKEKKPCKLNMQQTNILVNMIEFYLKFSYLFNYHCWNWKRYIEPNVTGWPWIIIGNHVWRFDCRMIQDRQQYRKIFLLRLKSGLLSPKWNPSLGLRNWRTSGICVCQRSVCSVHKETTPSVSDALLRGIWGGLVSVAITHSLLQTPSDGL